MNRLPTLVLLLFLCTTVLPGCGGPQPTPTASPPPAATISGLVFRDLNSDGSRDAREPGEPGVTVSAYDAAQRLVCTATTDVSGRYVLNAGLDPAQIVASQRYEIVFSGWPDPLAPGPHGPDSGTEQQFVTGGTDNASLGLFSPGQYVPPQATTASLIAEQTAAARATPTPAPVEATATVSPAVLYAGLEAAPAFPEGPDWLNTSQPLTWADLKGKIVLLEFWTYGCINSIQAVPRLKALQDQYPGELVVIGVHSAKFPHEAETDNIRAIIQRYDIDYPVINDKDYTVAALYNAHVWPTYVVVNPLGKYVGTHEGHMLYSELDRIVRDMVQIFDARGELDRAPLAQLLVMSSTIRSHLAFPNAILADAAHNRLFMVDSNHHRLIVADLAGTVQDVIGSGQPAWQDGEYGSAAFFRPQGITLAGDDTLYVADTGNHLLRRVDLAARTVTTVAGTGEPFLLAADSGPALQSRLNSPWDVRYIGGLVYIAMAGQHQIWVYDPARERIDLYAGTGTEELRDGPLSAAGFNQPTALATDGTVLYVADSEASAVRAVDLDPAGSVRTIVGQGFAIFGDSDGPADATRLQRPAGIACWDGLLYVADTYNHKIKTVDPATGQTATLLGSGEAGADDGPPPTFNEPSGLSIAAGLLYIADTNNHAIRVVDLATGQVTTLLLSDPGELLAMP